MSQPRSMAQNTPHQVQLDEGTLYEWCTCGLSRKGPFCDGSHEGTDFKPLQFVARRTGVAMLCGCCETGDPPYCDGTHDVI
jgi:CDGSH-type Zn-finger protein